jgi:hypothetical protein
LKKEWHKNNAKSANLDFIRVFELSVIIPYSHANASINIFAGVDVRTLQGMLGHSTPTTTLSVYTHVFNAAQAAQSAALDRFVEVIPFPTTAKNNFSDIGHQTDIKIIETVKCASCEMA